MMYFISFVIAALVVAVMAVFLWGVEKLGNLISDFSTWLQKVMK